MKMNLVTKIFGTAVLALVTLQSCQKEKEGVIGCFPNDPPMLCEPAYCDTEGEVVNLPSQCATEPSDVKGIKAKDGEYYMITQDNTGQLADLPVGTLVTFDVIESKEPCGSIALACHVPAPATCGILNCINPYYTPSNGGGGNNHKPDPDPNCNATATVVSYNLTGSTVKGEGKLLRINGKHYAVSGLVNNEISDLADGTQVSLSYVIEEDCILPAVMTTPTINGCVRIGCFEGRTIGH